MDEINVEDIDFSFNEIDGSGNDNSTNNNLDLALGATNSFNEDNSTNTGIVVENSGNSLSQDETTTVTGSFNDNSDNSVNDSGNDSSDNSVNDSFNELNVDVVEDNSVNAGNREYNTGGSWGGAGGGSGDSWSNVTIVDQSTNAVGDGGLGGFNTANVASGAGSIAAGGDVTQSLTYDGSTDISATDGSNINIDSDVSVENITNSGNTDIETNETVTNDYTLAIDNSFNDESVSFDATDSFNTIDAEIITENWDIDANGIWNSDNSGIEG